MHTLRRFYVLVVMEVATPGAYSRCPAHPTAAGSPSRPERGDGSGRANEGVPVPDPRREAKFTVSSNRCSQPRASTCQDFHRGRPGERVCGTLRSERQGRCTDRGSDLQREHARACSWSTNANFDGTVHIRAESAPARPRPRHGVAIEAARTAAGAFSVESSTSTAGQPDRKPRKCSSRRTLNLARYRTEPLLVAALHI